MLKIQDLKNEDWMHFIHYTLNLSQRQNKVQIILQGFIEVEVGSDIYTFVQQSRVTQDESGAHRYLAAVGRLIAGLRLQAAISMWRARGFHDLKTCKYNDSAVLVIHKSEYPVAPSPYLDFVNSKILSCLRDSVVKRAQFFDRFSSYPYTSISIGNSANDQPRWDLMNLDFEERIRNWLPHISMAEAVSSIFTSNSFNFFEALKKYAPDIRLLGIEPELAKHEETEELARREELHKNLARITARLNNPEYLTYAKLEALDEKLGKSRPTSHDYEKHRAPEVDVPAVLDTSELRAKPRRNDVIEMPDTRRLALCRQGSNDLEIEVYRNHAWIPSYMSDLRKGEFFLVAQKSPYGELPANRCFVARDGVLVLPTRDPNNPTFMVQGLEITTAPATPETNPMLRNKAGYSADLINGVSSEPEVAVRNSAPAALLFNTKPVTPSE